MVGEGPILAAEESAVIDGDMIYALAADIGNDSETQKEVPTYEQLVAVCDADHDGKVTVDELRTNPKFKNNANQLDERDWKFYRARMEVRNTLLAVCYGGRGDITESKCGVEHEKVPSELHIARDLQERNVRSQGRWILTAIDPKTGKMLKQGRLMGALDLYHASPVATAGKVYLLSQQGKATVVKAGADWEVLAVNDLEDDAVATPAIVDDRLYIRTRGIPYCFAGTD